MNRESFTRSSRSGCKCRGKRRKLVVCIDGTLNQFGKMNTNVVELYSRLDQDDNQLTYYASGIGSFGKPSWKSYSYYKRVIMSIIDVMIAWNFEKGVKDAYRWLVDNYQDGDQIFLFGFSRGAYQVRTVAGMIDKVGLLRKGNQGQIPFAYELYCDSNSDDTIDTDAVGNDSKGTDVVDSKENMLGKDWSLLILLINLIGLFWSGSIQSILVTYKRYQGHCEPYQSNPHLNNFYELSKSKFINFLWVLFIWLRMYHLMKRGRNKIRSAFATFNSDCIKQEPDTHTRAERLYQRLWHFGIWLGLFHLEPEFKEDNKDAERFKKTFSKKDVCVHFLGAWDTVSSIGTIRAKDLPGTSGSLNHICYFRHALALDECRVKFLPEYASGAIVPKGSRVRERGINTLYKGSMLAAAPEVPSFPHIKEVWFSGSHSDIGGGNVYNVNLNRRHPAFLWMSYEATAAGLAMKSDDVEWNWEQLGIVHESLASYWNILEYLPIKRPAYAAVGFNLHRFDLWEGNKNWKQWMLQSLKFFLHKGICLLSIDTDYTWFPHFGQGREVLPGQKVHVSVAFCPARYHPKALLPSTFSLPWEFLVRTGDKTDDGGSHVWDKSLVEMDIFDVSLAATIVNNIENLDSDMVMWVHRLTAMTWGREGRNNLRGVYNVLERILKRVPDLADKFEPQLQVAVINAVIAITKNEERGLDSGLPNLLWGPKGLSHNSTFLKNFVCDENVTETKIEFLRIAAKDYDLWSRISEHNVLNDLFHMLRSKKIIARRSACAILVGLGEYHQNIRSAMLMSGDIETVYTTPSLEDSWPLLRVIVGLASKDDVRNKIIRSKLAFRLLEGLRRQVEGVNAKKHVRESLVSAIAGLALYDEPRSTIAASVDNSFYSHLVYLLEDKSEEGNRAAAAEAIAKLAVHDGTRLTISLPFIASLAGLLGNQKENLLVLRILGKLVTYGDVRQKILDSENFHKLHKLSIIGNYSVLRETVGAFNVLGMHEDVHIKIFSSDFIDLLIKQLGDENSIVRLAALALLRLPIEHNDTCTTMLGYISHFTPLLEDKAWYIRIAALRIISKLGKYDDTHSNVMHAITPFLENLFTDESDDVRQATADTIKKLTICGSSGRSKISKTILPFLINLLTEKSAETRKSTACAIAELAKYGDTRSVVLNSVSCFMENLFEGKSIHARQSILASIADLAKHEMLRRQIVDIVLPSITQLVNDGTDIRLASAEVLRELARHDDSFLKVLNTTLPLLPTLLQDDDNQVRCIAVTVVSELARRDDTCLKVLDTIQPYLEKLLGDKHNGVCQKTVMVITELIKHVTTRLQVTKYAEESLAHLLRDKGNFVTRQAIVDAIIELAKYDDTCLVAFSISQPFISDLLHDPVTEIRSSAVEAVEELAAHDDIRTNMLKSIINDLVALLQDKNYAVRKNTVAAITEISCHVDTRSTMLNSIQASIKKNLEDKDWDVCRSTISVITAMAKHDDIRREILRDILPSLMDLLKDNVWHIRDSAVTTIIELAKHDDTCTMVMDLIQPFFASLLEDEVGIVRSSTIGAVKEFAKHNDTRLRALDSVAPHLKNLLKGDNAITRRTTVAVINELAQHAETHVKLQPILCCLEELHEDINDDIRHATAFTINKLKQRTAKSSRSGLRIVTSSNTIRPEPPVKREAEHFWSHLDDSFDLSDNDATRQTASAAVINSLTIDGLLDKLEYIFPNLLLRLERKPQSVRDIAIRQIEELIQYEVTGSEAVDLVLPFIETLVEDDDHSVAIREAIKELANLHVNIRLHVLKYASPFLNSQVVVDDTRRSKVISELASYGY